MPCLVDSIKIELNCRAPRWYQRTACWCGNPTKHVYPHTGIVDQTVMYSYRVYLYIFIYSILLYWKIFLKICELSLYLLMLKDISDIISTILYNFVFSFLQVLKET